MIVPTLLRGNASRGALRPVTQTGIGRVQVTESDRPWARFNFSHPRFNVLAYQNQRDAPVQRGLGLSEREFGPMWDQAQRVLAAPDLARFFDPRRFRRAVNEVSYVGEDGNVRRIDRLVELDDAVWVLDYKTGDGGAIDPALMAGYRAQLAEYRDAMRLVYGPKYGPQRRVSAAIIFADGKIMTLED